MVSEKHHKGLILHVLPTHLKEKEPPTFSSSALTSDPPLSQFPVGLIGAGVLVREFSQPDATYIMPVSLSPCSPPTPEKKAIITQGKSVNTLQRGKSQASYWSGSIK